MGGSSKIKLSNEARQADAALSRAYRDDFDRFQREVLPLVNEQMRSLDDRSIIRQAREDVSGLAERSADQQKRNAARYGLGMTRGQRAAMAQQANRDIATLTANTENKARLTQKDRNENVALSLAGIGNSYRNQALQELQGVYGNESSRAAGNAASASAARQANLGTAASLAMMAMSV